MTRLHTILATSMLCIGVTACGDATLLAPGAPRFDGGSTIGSGNRAGSDTTASERGGGFTIGSGNSIVGTTEEPTTERGGSGIGSGNRTDETTTSSTATTTDTDPVERGGHTLGSGNRTESTSTSTTTERGGHTIGSNN